MEKLEDDYNIFDWWKKVVFQNYLNFGGRARRKEFWMFQLVNILIILSCSILFTILVESSSNISSAIAFVPLVFLIVYLLLIFLPLLAVSVRRLHDTNRSGWYYLFGFIPYVGGIIMLVFYVGEGTSGTNQYGYDPKKPIPDNEIDEIGQIQE